MNSFSSRFHLHLCTLNEFFSPNDSHYWPRLVPITWLDRKSSAWRNSPLISWDLCEFRSQRTMVKSKTVFISFFRWLNLMGSVKHCLHTLASNHSCPLAPSVTDLPPLGTTPNSRKRCSKVLPPINLRSTPLPLPAEHWGIEASSLSLSPNPSSFTLSPVLFCTIQWQTSLNFLPQPQQLWVQILMSDHYGV